MALEGLRDDLKAAAGPASSPERPKGSRFSDMMQNRTSEDSANFLRWVENSGTDPELARRFASDSMAAGDIDKLGQHFDGFEQRKGKVLEVAGQMTPQQILRYAENVPLLQSAIQLKDAASIASVFKDYLGRVAFREPAEFLKVENAFDNLKSFREGEFKRRDEEIQKQLATLGVPEGKWREIMQVGDEATRGNALTAAVKENLWFWQRPMDWRKTVARMTDAREKADVERLVNELNQREKEMGEALGLLADENATIRKAVNQELRGMREKPEKEMSFSDASDAVKNFRKTFNVDVERDKFYNKEGYAGKTPKEKAAITRSFNDLVDQKFRDSVKGKGEGKWLEIFLALFGMKVKIA